MFTISKWFNFEAAHFLTGLPEGHQCGRVHGHSYRVCVVLRSPLLNEHGFVLDYNEFKFFGKFVDETLDHKLLNDVLPMQPSAENMARYFFHWLRDEFRRREWDASILYAVRVKETEKTEAEYCSYV